MRDCPKTFDITFDGTFCSRRCTLDDGHSGECDFDGIKNARERRRAEDECDSLRAKLATAERERDELRSGGNDLVRQFENVSRALNDIGWPSENKLGTERACDALRALKARVERAERERDREIRHPMAPDRCPQCNWTNVRLMNYGESVHGISESIWLCHGCAATRIRERDEARALAEVRGREVARLTEECEAFATPIDILTKRIERETAEAIAAWLSGPQPMRGAPTAIVTGPLDKIVKSSLEQAAKSIRAGSWRATKGKP